MLRIFIHSTIPAPYRTGVFDLLKKEYDTIVFFERINDDNRNSNWFIINDKYHFLSNKKDYDLYKKEIKKINDYDIVLIYEYSTFFAMKLMLKCILKKTPYYINCDGAFIKPHPLKDLIKRFFIKRANGCLASGEYSKRYLMNFGASKKNIFMHKFSSLYEQDILSSICEVEEKANLKTNLGLENKLTAITVGQFIHRKGFDILIRSWAKVNKEYNLMIIGGGDCKPEYESLILQLGLKNIKLVDFMTPQQLKEFYKASDLFILPTREDVWGLVVNEAMANGLPVITTDKCIAGLELIQDDENGFIVPVDNDSELANKINIILSDDNLRRKISLNNLNKIKNYTIENIAKKHIEVFNNFLSKPN